MSLEPDLSGLDFAVEMMRQRVPTVELQLQVLKLLELLQDIESTMDGADFPSLGYDIETRMAAVLRPKQ